MMKRLLLTAVCLAAMATARAQTVPMYSEVYNEKTGALESKEWVAANGNSRQETVDGGVHIFRLDSMMMYILDPAAKTARAMSFSQMSDPNKMAGRVVQTSHSEKREFIRTEDVEGYSCNYETVTIVNTRPDGTQEGGVEHMWMHEPLKTWIRYGSGQFLHGETSIRRNIRPGAQPASLFEIPRDYAVTGIPNLMEMMTGRKQTDEQKQQTMSEQDKQDVITGGKGNALLDGMKQQQEKQDKLKNAIEAAFSGGGKE